MTTASENHSLYQLIRGSLQSVGTSRTTVVALRSYIDAIQNVLCEETAFGSLVAELNHVLKNTTPKIVCLKHLIEEFETEMGVQIQNSLPEMKKQAVELLTEKIRRFESDTLKLTEHCAESIQSGDFIITSSPTGYIRDALIISHTKLKRVFRVLVLKHDVPRTRELIKALDQHSIPYVLIPQYHLNHFLKETTKLFISAVSVTADNMAVTGIGTANTVSICHAHNLPVYLFVESLKFSKTPLSDQNIHMEKKMHSEKDFTFHMTTFSNDFVDLGMIDHIITEKGKKMLP